MSIPKANYSIGARHCLDHARRLCKAAHATNDLGEYSTATFLILTATEELSKGLFCSFAAKGWIDPILIGRVFFRHEQKSILFEILLDGVSITGEKIQIDHAIFEKHLPERYRKIYDDYMNARNASLYVDLNDGNWVNPDQNAIYADSYIDASLKYLGLEIILDRLINPKGPINSYGSFKIKKENGILTIIYEEN